ncbi:MAG: hypothetical protein E6H00_05670 [Bacillati bacterium ANGP1]|uniref:Uncharacterized protein n=1 Tax=Candidatus Segetimicrobium genomatis TaxID=2569760 RepID=A0A537K5A6_9BACT|nr:MAG: hypothetical protein E6H00_05670 [Terrabacteria group bacterium ANGP1]
MNSEPKRLIISLVAVVAVGIGGLALSRIRPAATQAQEAYAPVIRPADFVGRVDNRYFPLAPGTTFVSRGAGSGATETMVVTGETKTIMGVKTTQVRDREVNKNNELIEDTYDWYAQDKNGDVWYFGEDTTVYKHGKAVSKAGTWEAGKNGALPGIIMKKHPQVDESWRQEYSKGVAEDMAQVLGTTETVTVPAGTYTNCVKTKDWDARHPYPAEYKYYCPDAGVVLETPAVGLGRTELISIRHK